MLEALERLETLYVSYGIRGIHRPIVRKGRKQLEKTLTQRKSTCRFVQNTCRSVSPNRFSTAEPFKRLWIAPEDIEFVSGNITKTDPGAYHLECGDPFHFITRGLAPVIDGDWDQQSSRFTEFSEYSAVHEVYNRNGQWKDTQLFENHRKRIKAGYRSYGCYRVTDLTEKMMELDKLLNSIDQQGYQSQMKLGGHPADEIRVNIGRNGNFLYNSEGRHRLAIAKVLGVKKIPVIVHVRHAQWEQTRKCLQRQSELTSNKEYNEHNISTHADIKICEPQ